MAIESIECRTVAWDQAGMVFLCRLDLTTILTCKAWWLCK